MTVRFLNFPFHRLLIPLLVGTLALLLYSPLLDHQFDFVFFDDPSYVTNNRPVVEGFTPQGIWMALTESCVSCYHPLTILSLMLDYQLLGPSPVIFHFTNVVLHSLNAALVFLVLYRLTQRAGGSAGVAILFAVHPTRVESVAWISERKDCLFLLFWLLATLAYVSWVQKGKRGAYLGCVILFVCSLLSKPMAVTFPAILLILDFWPLRRVEISSQWGRSLIRLVSEKLPLFALSGFFCLMTILSQSGAMSNSGQDSLFQKAANIPFTTVLYLGKVFWPGELSIIYPYRPASSVEAMVSAAILIGISALAIRWRASKPYILAGWAFFLVTLLPIVGVVQVGVHSIADRYMYLPALGIFWICLWLGADLLRRWPFGKAVAPGIFCAVALYYVSATALYLPRWKDTGTLFSHALEVHPENPYALRVLAGWNMENGRFRESASQWLSYLQFAPNEAWAWTNLGISVGKLGDIENARRFLEKAVEVDPAWAPAWRNLAEAYVYLERWKEAEGAILRFKVLSSEEKGATPF